MRDIQKLPPEGDLPVDGHLLNHAHAIARSDEERMTAILATVLLNRTVQKHYRKEDPHALEIDNEDDVPFLYGQDFDLEPEVWDLYEDPEDPRELL
jgi:hypothetical protein